MRTPEASGFPAFPYYQLFLSLRYLRSRFSALAALLAVAFGTSIIVVVLSIMGGYIIKLRENIRGQESHLMVVDSRQRPAVTGISRLEALVSRIDGVVATAPFIDTLAMYRSAQFNPCQVRGILPEKEVAVSSIGEYVLRPEELDQVISELVPRTQTDGSAGRATSGGPRATRAIDALLHASGRRPLGPHELAALFGREFRSAVLERHNPTLVPDLRGEVPPACLVGIHLLLDRELFLGQVLSVITLKPETSEPVFGKFVVVGAFKSGDYKMDSKVFYVHVDALKNMLGLFDPAANAYRYSGLRVAISDLSRLRETKARIEAAIQADDSDAFRDLMVITWEQRKSNFLSAVKIERFLVYFLMCFVVAFTACMVLLMLVLTVIEKTRDVGVLTALGATPLGVVRIFLTNGMVLSAAGTALGLALGYLFCAFINPIHDWIYSVTGLRLFPAEIYQMDRIPVAFQPLDVLLSIGPPLVLCFLASLVPAMWAARRDPIKAIHHE